MKYYHRYGEDGTCKVICTQCFLTLGIADGLAAARDMEAAHVCTREGLPRAVSHKRPGDIGPCLAANGRTRSEKNKILNLLAVALSMVFLLYALPTVVEIAASRVVNPWVAMILPGDLIGCAWLIAGLKMRRTGMALYLALTFCEGCLYLSRIVPVGLLPWIADIVPTCVAVIIMARARMRTPTPLRASS
ncbi:MAG: hypothetical protein WA634_04925 [Silvibacterium sp.]